MGNDVNSLAPGGYIQLGNLGRFIPEPKSQSGINFKNVLSSVGSLVSGGVGAVTGVDFDYQALLMKQIEVQEQMQAVSMASNIEKSKHETQMAPVRNIRVG